MAPSGGLRPPGNVNFTRREELGALAGHVLLAEFLEERPALMGRAGMGAKLFTLYQRRYGPGARGGMQRALAQLGPRPCGHATWLACMHRSLVVPFGRTGLNALSAARAGDSPPRDAADT